MDAQTLAQGKGGQKDDSAEFRDALKAKADACQRSHGGWGRVDKCQDRTPQHIDRARCGEGGKGQNHRPDDMSWRAPRQGPGQGEQDDRVAQKNSYLGFSQQFVQ